MAAQGVPGIFGAGWRRGVVGVGGWEGKRSGVRAVVARCISIRTQDLWEMLELRSLKMGSGRGGKGFRRG